MPWKILVDQIENVDKALQNKLAYVYHVGGNVYCGIDEDSVCVDIRQYWKPNEEVVPTKKGIYLRPKEYNRLKELIPSIGRSLNRIGRCTLLPTE